MLGSCVLIFPHLLQTMSLSPVKSHPSYVALTGWQIRQSQQPAYARTWGWHVPTVRVLLLWGLGWRACALASLGCSSICRSSTTPWKHHSSPVLRHLHLWLLCEKRNKTFKISASNLPYWSESKNVIPSFWNNGHSIIIGNSEIPTKIPEQLNSKVKNSWTADSKIGWQGIPTSPRIHADEGSSPTASLILVSVREKTGSNGARGECERREPHTSLQSTVGKLEACSGDPECKASVRSALWALAWTPQDRSPHTVQIPGSSIRIEQEAG